MDALQTVVSYVLNDLGAAVFVPALMLIIGLCMKMKFSEAFISALTLGIAFTGMSILIDYMMESMGDAAASLAQSTGVNLPAVDGGWPGMAAISWAWPYAFLMFPLTIGINILLLIANRTKTLNVDMWNVWNKIFTAVMVSYITGSTIWGFVAASIQIILELKAGDIWGPEVERLTSIPGVTVPHFITLICTLLFPIDELLKKIPFFNRPMDADALKEKIGIFGENSVMGGIIGLLLGLASGYGVAGSLQLAVQAATALTLFPMVSKLFSQALSPISEAISDFMKKRFEGKEVFIGLDWPILAGRNELWVAVIITIPVLLILAIVLPGNIVLPFAGIINLSFVVGALLLTNANLGRMIFHGVISAPLFLYGATYFAQYVTRLANETGAANVPEGKLLSWSTFEGPDIRYLFATGFSGNILSIILLVIWLGLFYWMYTSKKKYNQSLENE
ncbi:PTS galactitol transporter subunit IIC [Tetragenococcus koreensis]|uniref:Galactitol-specific PTS system IIC component n=1 Tax=Tetragenococcus koreensis TaxID=290335 RepID=A0AAN4UCI8_9ENTE|nr:PTS transporter subunit IIC [Tetragenococcus koreensis]MDN6473876.1 PTS galactitol transporter subunit IIC [Lactococcus lactis]AYW46634.1 PTS galactitol transporter subunit IIC [Tetragenococcus koreensis]MCF1617309.1 PTS galactitol transporter subunit IIC [Tetragenococcus koreensis]MCF1619141.1 PTS galactitol transporter subunit IIC [Tetragenococcus koreensis]MCF1622704.1 PTS galactitol transporter subunit IIC [Tetragenococcus koreensis]